MQGIGEMISKIPKKGKFNRFFTNYQCVMMIGLDELNGYG
jgi:hypothetical protein